MFSLFQNVRTGSVAYPAYFLVGTNRGGGAFPGVKRLGREADHSPQPVPTLRMSGVVPVLPAIYFNDVQRGIFILFLG